MFSKILVGADPELFVINGNSGAFVSAHDMIPGTKYEPYKVPYGAVQVDGTALEFNIDPAATVAEFVHNITSVRKTLEGMVPGYNVVAEPVANFDATYFKWDVPETAQALGCDPDFSGWTMDMNPPPNPEGRPLRTAAGHIHVGWTEKMDVNDKDNFELGCKVARQLDYYLGIYSLLWDKDGTRRQLYGKAGAFRPKPYGMEYRVLSNRWLTSDKLMRWVFNSVQAAMVDADAGTWAQDSYGDLAKDIINDNQVDWPMIHNWIDLNLDPVPIAA